MQRGLFRYDVTACETKVLICFITYYYCCYYCCCCWLFSSGFVLVILLIGDLVSCFFFGGCR